jgi:cyanate lyase
MAKQRGDTLTDQLRQAIDDCGLTRHRISMETGIDQAVLSKFCLGQRELAMESLDTLGEFLGLRIVKAVDSQPAPAMATAEAKKGK